MRACPQKITSNQNKPKKEKTMQKTEQEKEEMNKLPPLPDGAVLLGKGGTFRVFKDEKFKGWSFNSNIDKSWDYSKAWSGGTPHYWYAAPKDSEIAKLNGLSDDPQQEKRNESETIFQFDRLVVVQKKKDAFYEDASQCLLDGFSNGALSGLDLGRYLETILNPAQNKEELKEMFLEGMTPFLLPNCMKEFEQNDKILIFQLLDDETGKVILTIGDEDIQF